MKTRELAFYLNPCGPDRRAIMKLLAEAGVRRIGTDGFPWQVDKDRPAVDAFLRDCRDFGLSVYSMHGMLSLLARADSDMPADLMTAHVRDLQRLAVLGGKTVVYHACWMRDVTAEQIDTAIAAVGWDAFVARYAKALRDLAAAACELGLDIVVENIWHSVHSQSVAGYMDIIRAADAPNVGILLDSGHAHLAGKSVGDEIRTAGSLLRDTHFHDNVGCRNGVFFDQHIPPGLGTIDWHDACRALNEINFPGPVVFEGVLGPGDSIEKGRFGGQLSHRDIIEITIRNWRAFEALASQAPPASA
ncbi:MAG: hypothetical protein A3K19_21925 [Lentisphaerae bacterium RIFOXYB12_FULL_65_16]|nr:MAG: hypothetical protein A3K18_04325 [Lentisphaerae bacterium RIFOXYA12_64_32]OGV93916.1 MAG: hypothetical protein A3K19_21925 [Lentisphaerae bacterium RIFOXYB12_FULL_65_16]